MKHGKSYKNKQERFTCRRKKEMVQEIDRETALQTSQNEETNRIPITLTYHSQNQAIKNVILKNFKILCNDPQTKYLFPLSPLILFKRD